MATYNFDLLDLADGESGEAAVSVVVGKKKTDASAAKPAAAAEPTAQEKAKDFYYTKLQHDQGVRLCQKELTRLRDVLRKLRGEETKLMKEQPANCEARLEELSDEQRKLRLAQSKLCEQFLELMLQKEAFYKDNRMTLSSDDCKDTKLVHDEGVRLCQLEQRKLRQAKRKLRVEETELRVPGNEARLKDLSDEQQKLTQEQRKLEQQEVKLVEQKRAFYKKHKIPLEGDEEEKPTSSFHDANADSGSNHGEKKPSSDASTQPEHKLSSDAGTEAGTNADHNAVPASESEKSAGGAHNGQGAPTGTRNPSRQKEKINGSEKRKKKIAKKNSGNEQEKDKKQDSKVDGSKNQADQQPPPVYPKEEEKKTLAEYEKMREEKKKSLEASKTEVRKVAAKEFDGKQMLEKKKLDDEEAVIKVEKALQPKVKEASKKDEKVQAEGKDVAAKDGKPKKVVAPCQILGFIQPQRAKEDGSFARGRFNGGFQGSSRYNNTEPRVFGHGDNGRAAQNEAGGYNGNGAPRGAYNGPRDNALRGDYNRGNGGYGYGRGNGYQGNGGNQQQHGGNVGRFHQQERAGNGGYYSQRRPSNNDRFYQQRDNSGDGRNSGPAPTPAAAPDVKLDMSLFPALPARSAAPAPAQASAPAPATAA
ncbi:unnamed protein product [Urochloa decumbens]|uniref:Uncharacterized protein n=1 Tax=Urochloa decumbens TaxID=240449 RepID=A0ABC9D9M7_9POAL